jgi:chorismate mutase
MRAIRGAACLEADDATEMREAMVELLAAMMDKNGLTKNDLVSILFTGTPDLHSTFPATAARSLDLADVPLICAQEMDVTGAMPRVVRVMMHANVDTPLSDIKHIYIRGAETLRQDIAQ